MPLSDLVTPARILLGVRAAGKRQLLEMLARHAAGETGLAEKAISDALLERERLGTTAIGRGIALPHGRPEGLTQLYGLLAIVSTPIPFGAADEAPVDLVFVLLAPEGAGADHLKALARISRALRGKGTPDALRAAESPDAAMAILTRSIAE